MVGSTSRSKQGVLPQIQATLGTATGEHEMTTTMKRTATWPQPIPRKPARGSRATLEEYKREQRAALDKFKKMCGG